MTNPASNSAMALVEPSRTAARIENIKALIAHMQVVSMTLSDICNFLRFSASGARKYIRDLADAGLFVVDLETFGGEKNFNLIDDAALVQAFLDRIGSRPALPRKAKRDQMTVAKKHAGRQFHLLADDVYNYTRVAKMAVEADPLALPKAFFATAAREALRADEIFRPDDVMVIPISKQRQFPNPADYRLDLGSPT